MLMRCICSPIVILTTSICIMAYKIGVLNQPDMELLATGSCAVLTVRLMFAVQGAQIRYNLFTVFCMVRHTFAQSGELWELELEKTSVF